MMTLKIQDLIDIEQFQLLQDRLNEIYSFPSAIIDNDGKVLTATAWQDICTKFHRQNSECEKECIKSDQYIADHLHEANPAVSYRCPHGLVDNATPIIINGVHYGNYFTGQFFLEPPDLNFFRAQAKKYGFDEEAYIEAVKKVPIWTQEQLNSYLFFIKGLIEVISAIGLKNIKEIEARKKIEEEEERASTILRQIQEGFWITIPEGGQIVDANKAMCNMLGYTHDELVGMTVSDVEANDSPKDIQQTIQQVIKVGSAHFESRFRRKDKSIIDVDVSITYLPKRNLFFGFHRDITERKLAEEDLRDERRMFIGGPTVVFKWVAEEGWPVEYVSPNVQAQLGYSAEDFINRKILFADIVQHDDLQRIGDEVAKYSQSGIPSFEQEYRIVRSDGESRWFYDFTVVKRDDSGQITHYQGYVQDITDRKRIEEELRLREQRLHSVITATPIALWEIDVSGNILLSEGNALSQLGLKSGELVGQSVFEANKGDLEALAFIRRGLAGEELSAEVQVGGRNWKNQYVPRYDERGRVSGLIGVSVDITEQKEAQEALRKSEERYKKLFHNNHAVMMIIDPEDGSIRDANPAACSYYGWSHEEFTKNKIQEINVLTPEEVAKEMSLARSEQRNHFFFKHRLKNGTIRDVDVYSGPITMDGKTLLYSIVHDISEKMQAEKALQQSELKYRSLFNNAEVGMFRTRLDGSEILEFNEKYLKVLGYTFDEVKGNPSVNLWADKRERDRMARQLRAEGHVTNFECDLLNKQGEVIHCVTSLRLYSDSGILEGSIIDITDRKRAEGQLREMTARLRLATDSAKAGVWDWNLQTNEMIWDNRMHELYGLTPENFPGGIKAWEQGLHPDDAARAIEECQAALRGEKEFDTEFRVKHPDGNIVYIKASGLVLRDNDGKPLRMIGLNSDISDQRKALEEHKMLQERLQRAEKMEALGQLAGGVAHDLNNVLGILSGYSELLLDEVPEGSKARSHVEKILQSTNKGAAIIDDLLTLARRGVTTEEVVNLNNIASDFMTTPSFENIKDYNPRVTFRADLEESLPNIKGSSVHLEKTLMNLVSNAAEAISGAGTVTMRTEGCYLEKLIKGYDEIKEGEYTVLTVSDTGSGIPAASLTKIFEPFYTKKKMGRSGTGLGLSIVWGTVKDHEGYIDIHTEEGKGTTFSLYFPVTEEKLAEPEAEVPIERYMGKGETVLVVDDRAGQREIASQLITKLGYQVHLASSGEAAVEYLKAQKADIIVLDMIMPPGMDGLDTYKRILEINPKQKAIIVSGFSESDRVKEARRLGVGAYVRKPYIKEKLGMAVRKEFDRSA